MQRPRRLRANALVRELVRDVYVDKKNLIQPVFVKEGIREKEEIKSMKGIYRHSSDSLLREIDELLDTGINKVLLFGIPKDKHEKADNAKFENGIVQNSIKDIKKRFGNDILLITDVCMCAYTTHGHCGILRDEHIVNDESADIISDIALSHVRSGADIVAPSDMMDERVKKIRSKLDNEGYDYISIMSYAAKYASNYYGPFRDAANSSPSFGDRKTYQMDYTYLKDAIKECKLDLEEGADILIVKPALSYLDIISKVKSKVDVPLAAYQVSGEYSMLKNAVESGLVNSDIYLESLNSIKRAGADIIITYFAKEFERMLK